MDSEEDSDHYEDHYTDNTSTCNEEMDDHVELDTGNSSPSMDMVEHHSEYDYDDTMYHYIEQGDHMNWKHAKDYHDYMSCDDDSTMLKSPPWRMDRHTLALPAQAFEIIGKRTMWLLIAKLHMHIVFDTLHRLGAMPRVHMHMIHHHDMIGIEMHHLSIVIDMRLHQGTKRTVTAVHPLAHRCSPTYTASFRLEQDRQPVIAVHPLAHRRSPTCTATFLVTHMGTLFIDILHLHRVGAMTRVHLHMSLHQGTPWSIIGILHRGIIIAIAHHMSF
jgi:hypothetical protein